MEEKKNMVVKSEHVLYFLRQAFAHEARAHAAYYYETWAEDKNAQQIIGALYDGVHGNWPWVIDKLNKCRKCRAGDCVECAPEKHCEECVTLYDKTKECICDYMLSYD